jgi:hypothetical protein
MVVAHALAEEPAQVVLRVAAAGLLGARARGDLQPRRRGAPLLRARDVAFLAHPLQHHPAAVARALPVRPGRQRRRRPDEPGHQRRLREVEVLRGRREHAARHGVHAVDAAAQVDAVQVELQDLVLAEQLLQQHRQRRFLQLADVAAAVRQEERPRELLAERAAALRRPARPQVVRDRAAERDRVEPGVAVEAVVLDRHHRVAQRRRDLAERDVVALLDEREPGPAVRGVEGGVADASRQPLHGQRMPRGPEERRPAEAGRARDQDRGDVVGGPAGPEEAEGALQPVGRSGDRRVRAHGPMTAFTTASASMSPSASAASSSV